MKKLLLTNILMVLALISSAQSAREIINSTIQEMGGIEKWKGIKAIKSSLAGHKYWLEQSESPDGPFITSYEITEEIRSVHSNKGSYQTTAYQFASGGVSKTSAVINENNAMVVFGARAIPMPAFFKNLYDEKFRYAPDYLLFIALKSNLKLERDSILNGTPHSVISFSKDSLEHFLYINQHTKMITEARIESFQPYSLYDYPWGKFWTTIKYSLYWLYKGGLRFPAQWDVYKLDKPYLSTTHLSIEFQTAEDNQHFAIPDSIKALPSGPNQLVNEIAFPADMIIEVAKGIHMIPGMWNVGTIVQDDGIFVIEAPISSGYNAKHLDWIKKTYPDKKIKGVITTSDAWPHVGGIRAFISREIPIYGFSLNEEIIRKISIADHSLLPDLQHTLKKEPRFQLISKAIKVDDKHVPIQLIPINGEGGERMISIYFPIQKVLYASDLIQRGSKKTGRFFSLQYLSEVKSVVDKYDLEVETVFAMHLPPTPWQLVSDELANEIVR